MLKNNRLNDFQGQILPYFQYLEGMILTPVNSGFILLNCKI
jgi:hypothetical protein